MPVVTKGLSKTVMKRSKLMQTECYTKSIETTAYTFSQKVEQIITQTQTKKKSDHKLFWKVIKPSLSDKSVVKGQINLIEKREILKKDLETAEVLNTFFGNIV